MCHNYLYDRMWMVKKKVIDLCESDRQLVTMWLVSDVEQTAMAFLDSQARLKSCKTKRHYRNLLGDKVEIAWNLASWRKTTFWAMVVALPQGTLDFGKFHHIAIENYDFAIYSNFSFLNNFLLKSQNIVSFVLGRSIRLIVYNFAFNSNFPFLVHFNILPTNLIISTN